MRWALGHVSRTTTEVASIDKYLILDLALHHSLFSRLGDRGTWRYARGKDLLHKMQIQHDEIPHHEENKHIFNPRLISLFPEYRNIT